ncbi:hypothetical protein MNEG_0330 [Monoraphidium neglectum]|uniref:Uncharacterized protein n=1 Tax=Monoraphidium neglectum TaxID=145388 RepID=A0A0D2MYV6_9CHLO|nr:hypothetical protein MNEG_0330 [Monoraphidium neglectum]KIZ07615.1 hypothetical protein MNEG_0330 [Monoraphidium neglectum]|eukprot:XP_013906634.1 hypothetical protein MNEG_0330 [Monoraphidium neglectum]
MGQIASKSAAAPDPVEQPATPVLKEQALAAPSTSGAQPTVADINEQVGAAINAAVDQGEKAAVSTVAVKKKINSRKTSAAAKKVKAAAVAVAAVSEANGKAVVVRAETKAKVAAKGKARLAAAKGATKRASKRVSKGTARKI